MNMGTRKVNRWERRRAVIFGFVRRVFLPGRPSPHIYLSVVAFACLVFATGFMGSRVASAALSQGFKTSQKLVAGTLVSLDNKLPGNVTPASLDRVDSLIGVVVPDKDSLLVLSNNDSTVQVATSGLVASLVSTINGDIKQGDKITVSPVEGVGMRAVASTKLIGIAQKDFNSQSEGASKQTVKDSSGKQTELVVGQIPILVNVSNYVRGLGDDKTIIPPFIQQISEAIAGKRVSTLRIIVAAILLIFTLMAIAVLIYSAVRSSIISIGRNPLSQGAVYRSLIQVVILVIGVLAGALGSVYLILSR